MKKLNLKNKIFIFIFSLIILGIIAILIVSVRLSNNNGSNTSSIYNVSTNSVIYSEKMLLVETKLGGEIKKSWNNNYFYTDIENKTTDLGKKSIAYEKSIEKLYIFGTSYYVSESSDVTKNDNDIVIDDLNKTGFYKLDDREYLITSSDIYNDDKTIYTNKYLIVTLDKQGNASFTNDVINVKTINPMKIMFDKYIFDIANEKLMINDNIIDLKLIGGSTNEYVAKSEEQEYEEADMTEFISSYNKLVNDFKKYVDNENLKSSSNKQIVNNTIVTQAVKKDENNKAKTVQNKTSIPKRVSLRGTISYPTYIDVTYLISDPEEKYQAVYLLITGYINGKETTEKIILDKYDTKYRIIGLEMKNEYSISLGYVDTVINGDTIELYDTIEDVINVRTTGCDAKINIEKISKGYVYFNFKMSEKYAIESGKIVLYSNDNAGEYVNFNYKSALSEKGFSGKLKLEDSSIYELKLEDAVYNSNRVELDISNKFIYQPLKNND